jgi:peroxiredoxin Q/BCP
MIEVSREAPDFCLEADSGDSVCIKDLMGKWVVLYFYPKDNTSGCTTEALEFSERIAAFSEMNAVVLGVSPDSAVSHKKFKTKHNLSVKLLSDPSREVLEKYGAWGTKKMYGKVSEGVIRSSVLIGPDGIVRKLWPKAKSSGHAQDVLDALAAMAK